MALISIQIQGRQQMMESWAHKRNGPYLRSPFVFGTEYAFLIEYNYVLVIL